MKPSWYPERRKRPATTVFLVIGERRKTDHLFPMSDGDATELKTLNRQALVNMLTGHGSEEALSICASALNLALAMAETVLGEEWTGHINEALEGIFRAQVRGKRIGRWAFDGRYIGAIKQAFDVHEAQLEQATRAELIAGIGLVQQRLEEGNVFTLDQDNS